jgi:hypothetical protein
MFFLGSQLAMMVMQAGQQVAWAIALTMVKKTS